MPGRNGIVHTLIQMKKILLPAVALVLAAAVSGCQIYRADIHQGQDSAADEADKLTIGMTREQVADIMGTPLVVDKFRDNRWDYLYSVAIEGGDPTVLKRTTVIFDGDRVAEIIEIKADSEESPESSQDN